MATVENSERSMRACFVCTHSLTLATLYKGLFPFLRSRGWELTVIVGDREYTDFDPEQFGDLHPVIIPMKRLPSPVDDIVGLFRFYKHFLKNKYDVVHVSTPKASLLASVARRLTGRSGVIFVYRRCVYEMMAGLKRKIYVATDKITSACSDAVVPISRQLYDFLARERIVPKEKLRLFGAGSSNGVDVDRFERNQTNIEGAAKLLESMDLRPADPIVLFVGRICAEKGVDLLPPFMERVRSAHPRAQLVVAGPDDARDPIEASTAAWFEHDPLTRRLGYVSDTPPLFALSTIFVFPSFFEGFGNVLLEAAASRKVSVAFDAPGIQEAVEHGTSGYLAPLRDVEKLADYAVALLDDPQKRLDMEAKAYDRVQRLFRREAIWAEIDALMRSVAR